jgi:hypothetical protein
MEWTGGCLCGDVRFETSSDPLWVGHCHCGMCRKHSGAPVSTYVGFPAGTVCWTKAEPARFRSSTDVERSFCARCGSTIGFHRVHETSLTVGSFDQADSIGEVPKMRVHVWFEDHLSWFDTADRWPRYGQFPPGGKEELEQVEGKPLRG